jgi:hypothetical protein
VTRFTSSHGFAELEALLEGCRDTLLLLDTDHRARLRRDLEGLALEERRAAHEAHELAVEVAHRVLGIMAVHGELHRLGHGEVGLELERVLEHHLRERGLVGIEKQVAHRDQAHQAAFGVDHVDVGHEGAAHQRLQRLDRLAHGHLGTEDGERRVHQMADRALRIGGIALPLLGDLGRRRCRDEAARALLDLAQDRLDDSGIELEQRIGRFLGLRAFEERRGLVGRQRLQLRGKGRALDDRLDGGTIGGGIQARYSRCCCPPGL